MNSAGERRDCWSGPCQACQSDSNASFSLVPVSEGDIRRTKHWQGMYIVRDCERRGERITNLALAFDANQMIRNARLSTEEPGTPRSKAVDHALVAICTIVWATQNLAPSGWAYTSQVCSS